MAGRRPFSGVSVLQVTGDRVVIPGSVSQYVSWYEPDQSQECLAIPAPDSGIAIFSPLELEARAELVSRVQERQLNPASLGSPLARTVLAAYSFWPVTIQATGELRLPAPARALGLLSHGSDGSVGLTAFCGVIQLWSAEELRRLLRELSGQWGELSRDLAEV